MEFNYFKTSVMSVMAAGAFAFSASMSAAAPVSVIPAEGKVETLENFTLVFNDGDALAWAVTGTENAPYLTRNGERIATAGSPAALKVDGNKLDVILTNEVIDEFYRKGLYELNIAEGSYTVNGEAGAACTFKWDVEGILVGPQFEPAVTTVTAIQNIRVTFPDYDVVELTEWDTLHGAYLYLMDQDGELQRRGTFFPQVHGNVLDLTVGSNAVTEPGEYVVKIDSGCIIVDGEVYNEPIQAYYTIVEPSYPEIELSVNPAVDTLETLETIEVTFGGVDVVEWNVNENTDKAPYLADLEGNRFGTFTVLGGLGNMLSLSLGYEFDVAGEYKVVFPAGSYKFGGDYNGLEGKEFELKFEILGLGGYSVEPAVDTLFEIQNIKVTFNGVKEVSLAPELGTTNTPYLVLVTEEGERERRGTLMPQVVANNLLLTMNEPIYEAGNYIVIIPGSTYLLDGNPGEDIQLNYKVVEPAYPEYDLVVNPAVDKVDVLNTIEITFDSESVKLVDWKVTGTGDAPYLVNANGDRFGTFTKLAGEGNMLSLSLGYDFDVKGEYSVVIPAGSYVFQGIFHGLAGKEINLNFEVLGVGGITVEPAVNMVSEIQNIKITFNEAEKVTVPEPGEGEGQLNTFNTPYLEKVNEDGTRERRSTFMPQAAGNNLLLMLNVPITEEGEYVVIVPGTTYFLDGNPGEDIQLGYTILKNIEYPEVDLSVNPAVDKVETIETIEVTFGGVEEVHWDIDENTAAAPYLADMEGNRWATFTVLSNEGNTLSLGLRSEFFEKGEYNVVIPAGSYAFGGEYNGLAGKEIVLSFEVLGLTGVSVEPAVDTLNEIQNIKITFHEAKSVTLAEDLGTTNTPYLVFMTEDGIRERRGTFMPQVAGNSMLLTMNEPIYEEGEYVVVVPGTTYFLDGDNPGKDYEFYFKVVAPAYPEVTVVSNPAAGDVETLETVEVTFEGVDLVAWNVNEDTSKAPYLADAEGNRWATFTQLSGEGNKLTLGLLSEFFEKGEYTLVLPKGSYVFQGIYHGMEGNQVEISYNVLGLTGISTEPAVNVLNEIQNIKVTFHEGKVVTLADDLSTLNCPTLYLVTEEGVRERRGTLMPQVAGNNMFLTMNNPIYDEGEYVVVIPGTCYFLDGNAGTDVEFGYTIIAPSYPEIDLGVNPAVDVVETIDNIELTFGGVDIVQWTVTGTEDAPYLVDMDGNRWATFANLSGQGNMLSLGLFNEFDVKGEYNVVIPAGSYVFGGVYQGMPGKEIVLKFEVLGLTGISVEPAFDTVTEIQNIKITFNEAKEVTLAEDLGTLNTPYLEIINEEGVRERRGTFFPQIVGGNNMLLTMYNPITEPGDYIVIIPGTSYFLDGNEGKDIELNYTVISTLTYSVVPAEGTVEKLDNIAITFDLDITDPSGLWNPEAYWNVTAINADESLCPYYVFGESTEKNKLENLWSDKTTINFGPKGIDALTEAGYYVVTVPAGSYYLGETLGEEIVLTYIVDANVAVDAIFGENVNVDVYDLNGRVVLRNADAAAIKALRGIYVINGKKYILR